MIYCDELTSDKLLNDKSSYGELLFVYDDDKIKAYACSEYGPNLGTDVAVVRSPLGYE